MEKAEVLIEALPYIRRFHGKTVVIKFGGAIMETREAFSSLVKNVVLLKYVGMRPVIVHGGGPQVSRAMEQMGLTASFVEGLRVTDAETMAVTEMVLNGRLNKAIVSMIDQHGGKAVGICGKDGLLLQARPKRADLNLGFVGEITQVNTHLLELLDTAEFIPVVSPVAIGENGDSYNVNADTAAGAIAAALRAEKFVLLTDVDGLLDKDGKLISEVRAAGVAEMIRDGVIQGGMLPKIEACLKILDDGVRSVHIINGGRDNSLLLELFTDKGIGTLVT
jgi:acetylglutamate kinase